MAATAQQKVVNFVQGHGFKSGYPTLFEKIDELPEISGIGNYRVVGQPPLGGKVAKIQLLEGSALFKER